MKETTIEVKRSDLIYLQRVMDSAFSELEAGVADGMIDESVLIELDDALSAVREYLDQKK